jgi:hypothetical protein
VRIQTEICTIRLLFYCFNFRTVQDLDGFKCDRSRSLYCILETIIYKALQKHGRQLAPRIGISPSKSLSSILQGFATNSSPSSVIYIRFSVNNNSGGFRRTFQPLSFVINYSQTINVAGAFRQTRRYLDQITKARGTESSSDTVLSGITGTPQIDLFHFDL